MRSIRRFSRASTSERGFALVLAVVLAILYFGLIELLMIDASRELYAARQFRAKLAAIAMAENAAELAAQNLATAVGSRSEERLETVDGVMTGSMLLSGTNFRLKGLGEVKGLAKARASVTVSGRIVNGHRIVIDYTQHTE